MADEAKKSVAISELPTDELVHYGRELGLGLNEKMGRPELLRRIRERQVLLLDLDREALLDIAVWARLPVRHSASKEELARAIAGMTKMNFQGLGQRGLVALARLRGAPANMDEPAQIIEERIRRLESLWGKIQRQRRQWAASVIARMVNATNDAEQESYRFLPEEGAPTSLKEHITEGGVVGGIARKIRSVADDYVREKLDEIELRIDRKLDEIDRRLEEWRDREVAIRLKMIRITLVASVLVALLSLGYSYLKGHW